MVPAYGLVSNSPSSKYDLSGLWQGKQSKLSCVIIFDTRIMV